MTHTGAVERSQEEVLGREGVARAAAAFLARLLRGFARDPAAADLPGGAAEFARATVLGDPLVTRLLARNQQLGAPQVITQPK